MCIDGCSGAGGRAANERTLKPRVIGHLWLRYRCLNGSRRARLPNRATSEAFAIWLIFTQETTTGVASTILFVLPSNVFARPRLPNAHSLFGPSALPLLSPLFILGTGQIATTVVTSSTTATSAAATTTATDASTAFGVVMTWHLFFFTLVPNNVFTLKNTSFSSKKQFLLLSKYTFHVPGTNL